MDGIRVFKEKYDPDSGRLMMRQDFDSTGQIITSAEYYHDEDQGKPAVKKSRYAYGLIEKADYYHTDQRGTAIAKFREDRFNVYEDSQESQLYLTHYFDTDAKRIRETMLYMNDGKPFTNIQFDTNTGKVDAKTAYTEEGKKKYTLVYRHFDEMSKPVQRIVYNSHSDESLKWMIDYEYCLQSGVRLEKRKYDPEGRLRFHAKYDHDRQKLREECAYDEAGDLVYYTQADIDTLEVLQKKVFKNGSGRDAAYEAGDGEDDDVFDAYLSNFDLSLNNAGRRAPASDPEDKPGSAAYRGTVQPE